MVRPQAFPDENLTSKPLEPLFSFRAQDMPLVDAIALFARANELNIAAGPEVKGSVTVDFHRLPLERSLQAILDAHGYYWVEEDNLIRVRRLETRLFTMDYIRLVRSGTGQSQAQLTSGSGSGGSGGGGGGGQNGGSISLHQEDQIKFWDELEEQLKALMSEEGRLVLNRLSGTIQVTDLHHRVTDIAAFLAKVRQSLYRQVEIEARIYEVVLDDGYSLGINWNEIDLGSVGEIVLKNIITAPIGGIPVPGPTAKVTIDKGDFDGVLEALQEQGEVKVISQPRIVTLNNQPALIKVATDESFFSSTVSQGSSGTGNVVTEQVRTVTVGLVLAVTPQISEDGWIMLDVTPITSRLRDVVVSPQGTATAPILDVRQTSSLVRLRDGQTVIIGGLIQDEVSDTRRSIPLLGDIPGIGYLFRGTFHAKRKSEMVIFLSPRITEMG